MRSLILVPLALLASGCIVAEVAGTAVDVAKVPVGIVSAGVDAATTSQSEADEKRGRALRQAEERRGREARQLEQRCRSRRLLPGDVCPPRP